MSKLNKSCIVSLRDNRKNRKKIEILGKLETMCDDIDNGRDTVDFFYKLDDVLEWGKTYRITIEEI